MEDSASHVPLLADAGMIKESTGEPSGNRLTQRALESGVWFSTLLGAAVGFCSPYLAIGITLLAAIGVSTWFHVVMPVTAIMLQLVTVMLFVTLSVYYGILLSWFKSDRMAEETMELMKLRFVLGALIGLLVSWVLTCLVLGFTFWDKVGLVSGLFTVIWSIETPAASLTEEDYQSIAPPKTKTVSIAVV